jgi:methionine sulfoxide reductase heme-binding subunit
MLRSEESISIRPVATGARAAPRRAAPTPWLGPGIFVGGLAPLVWLIVRAGGGLLSANPISDVVNETGMAALIFLVASLACTPARWAFGWAWPARVRRMLGLFAFFYALLHFLAYLALDLGFAWDTLGEDIATRPFITVGFAALVILTPLAVTSTNAWVRKLGHRRWARLHQLAYLAGVLAVVHFVWRVKIDLTQPLVYAAVVGLLLAARVVVWRRRDGAASGPARR